MKATHMQINRMKDNCKQTSVTVNLSNNRLTDQDHF